MTRPAVRHALLFETARFNLSEVRPHFVNPCCFGEDLAAWLRDRLGEQGVRAGEPGQEDWGWYLDAEHGGRTYLVGVGVQEREPDAPAPADGRGEWRVFVEKDRSLGERLLGRGRMAADEPIVGIVRRILEAEPDFRAVRADADA